MDLDQKFINLVKEQGTKALVVDEYGNDHEVPLNVIDFYIAKGTQTVKIEGLENKLPFGEKGDTVHMFISPAYAYAFNEHTEPYDVLLKCIKGKKTMVINHKEIVINEGEEFVIPANTPHYATNKYSSVMLSMEI